MTKMIVSEGFSLRPLAKSQSKQETETVVVGRRQLYTSHVVTIETNGEASEGASVSCHAEFCGHGKSVVAKV